nr:hypothetical protein BaRGS_017684 [Batillaria attramentaria]
MSDIVYEGVAPAHYHVNNNHNVIDNIGCRSVCGYAHRQINTTACVLVIACLIVVLIYVWKKRTKRDKTDSRLVAEGTENRSDSGGVYHQLEFDAKDRDQAATASGVYDHTA